MSIRLPTIQPPAIVIRLELEAAPKVSMYCANEAEEARLREWFVSRDDLLDLVVQALDLAEATA